MVDLLDILHNYPGSSITFEFLKDAPAESQSFEVLVAALELFQHALFHYFNPTLLQRTSLNNVLLPSEDRLEASFISSKCCTSSSLALIELWKDLQIL